jgi:hypothetical protein
MRWLDRLANSHKLFRRLLLMWACWLVTVVSLRATMPEALTDMSGPAASVVIGVIGILTTVIGLYQWMRQRDDSSAD